MVEGVEGECETGDNGFAYGCCPGMVSWLDAYSVLVGGLPFVARVALLACVVG